MCHLTEPSVSTSFALAKTAVCGNVIVLARPLSELFAHIQHYELPSLLLVARAIKTLVLSIFRWHLCDYVLLPSDHLFCSKIRERTSLINKNMKEENYLCTKDYPYMIESAFFLVLKPIQRLPGIIYDVIHDPFHERYKEISVPSLIEYYRTYEKMDLIPKTESMTVLNLLFSEAFNVKNYQEMM